MKNELRSELNYFEVSPKIIPVGTATKIRIINRDGSSKYGLDKMILHVDPFDNNIRPWRTGIEPYPFSMVNGGMEFEVTPKAMSEYRITLHTPEVDVRNGYVLRFFAVDEDIYERRPYKGDLHVHSTGSDGSESPAITAANYRAYGFDFFSLTDHENYQASLEVHEAYRDVSLGMTLLRGEECHYPGVQVHVVNFGGKHSVCEIYQAFGDDYRKKIDEFSKTIDIPEEVQPFDYEYAAAIWEAREIRKAGGLAIFPHPYWESYAYNVSTPVSMAFLKSGEFDAFELFGGMAVRENNYQHLLWEEALKQGVKMPAVSSSDSHCCSHFDHFGSMFTIVYAKSRKPEDLLQAVRDGYCCAVELRKGESPRVSGPFRLGLLTIFLLHEYYPIHDDICLGEGLLMSEYIRGFRQDFAQKMLDACADRTDIMLETLYK